MQLKELREYCARQGWNIVEYVDTGWSGKLDSRPQLNKLRADARLHRFDVVCVWKLDRWGRSVVNCIETIQELTSLKIRFVAITQNIDTEESNPMARFILHIMAAFAELERELIRERVIAGIKAAKHRGIALGRKRVVLNHAKVRELSDSGFSVRQIAAKLQLSRSVIHRSLQSWTPPAVPKR